MGDPAVQTAGVAIRMGCWPFTLPLEELEGYDYTVAVAALNEASRQSMEFWQSLAEFNAGKTIEFLGKSFKK